MQTPVGRAFQNKEEQVKDPEMSSGSAITQSAQPPLQSQRTAALRLKTTHMYSLTVLEVRRAKEAF